MSWAVRGPYPPSGVIMFWIAWEGTEEVGRLCLLVQEDRVMVATLFVKPPYRRQGVATALHEAAYAWARKQGRTFRSGVINGPENKAYWVRLVKQGRAAPVVTEHGEMYERMG